MFYTDKLKSVPDICLESIQPTEVHYVDFLGIHCLGVNYHGITSEIICQEMFSTDSTGSKT